MTLLSPSYSIGYTGASEHGYNIYRVKVSHRCSHNIYNPCRKSHSDVDPIWLWWRVSLLPPRHPRVCGGGLGVGFFSIQSESIECFIEDQAFSPSYDLAPVSKLDGRHIGRLRKRDNMLTREGRGGWGRSQIIRQRGSLVLFKSFNTLWVQCTTGTLYPFSVGLFKDKEYTYINNNQRDQHALVQVKGFCCF